MLQVSESRKRVTPTPLSTHLFPSSLSLSLGEVPTYRRRRRLRLHHGSVTRAAFRGSRLGEVQPGSHDILLFASARSLSERGHGTACESRNFRRHAKGKEAAREGRQQGEPGVRAGGTELEIDPWCSRWDAILFIVLIISEYIVRSRHAAPRSRIREIYAIETTPSPPPRLPPPHSSCLWFVPPRRTPFSFPPTRAPKYANLCVLMRVICARPGEMYRELAIVNSI